MCLQVITGSCYFKKSIKYELKKEIMKTIYVLFAFSFFAFAGFAQDTIQGQVIRVDTVKVEKVRVDTVYVQNQAQEQNQVQESKVHLFRKSMDLLQGSVSQIRHL